MIKLSHRFDYLFVVVLTVIYTLSYYDAGIILDTARDLYKADQIVSGKSLILQGPDLGGAIHLSGWWFYWLSIAGIFKTKWLIALWAGLTAGLKFIFAYLLGRQMISREFALCWVFAMTLPGWQSLEQFTFSHTNIVQSLALLFAFLLWRLWDSRDGRLLKWLALVFSLAVHAHPSAYGLLLLATPFLCFLLTKKVFSFRDIVWAILLALLTLVPYIVQQFLDDWPDFQQASEFSHHQISLEHIKTLPALWNALFSVGPRLFAEVVAGSVKWWEFALRCVYIMSVCAALIGIIVGIVRKTLRIKWLVLLAWALFSLSACVLFIRDITPGYMTYVILPVVSMVIAYGLSQLGLVFRSVLWGGVGLSFLLTISTWAAMVRFTQNDEFIVPEMQLRQVKMPFDPNWREQTRIKIDTVTVRQAEVLGRYLCDRRQRQLHGPMVANLDLLLGVVTQFNCPATALTLSGDDKGYALLSALIYAPLERKGFTLNKLANYAVVETVTPLKSVNFQLVQPNDYLHPPRRIDTSQETIDLSATLPRNALVMITDYLSFYRVFSEPSIIVNGQIIEPIADNYYTRVYYCEDCQGDIVQWNIHIDSVNQDSIDVVYFELEQ